MSTTPRYLRNLQPAASHEQYFWPPRDEFVKPQPRRRKPSVKRPTGSPFTYGTGLNPALTGRNNLQEEAEGGGREGDVSELRRRTTSIRRNRSSSRSSSKSGSDTSSSPSILLSDYDDRISLPREEDEGEEDSDEIPLGSLAARRQQQPRRRVTSLTSRHPEEESEEVEEEETDEDEEDLDPNRVVRIRRGSEGYEVRPRFFQPPPPPDARGSEDDEEWDQLEGEMDEGDPYADEMVSEGELDEEGNRVRNQRYKYYVREEDSESDTEDEREVELEER